MDEYAYPQIHIRNNRECLDSVDTNCFRLVSGCTSTVDVTYCNSTAGFSFSVPFVGTGIDLLGGLRCVGASCKWALEGSTPPELEWQIDGTPIPKGSESPSPGLDVGTSELLKTDTGTLIRTRGLSGGPTAKHTLSIQNAALANVGLVFRYANVLSEENTPVGPRDNIWLSARHGSLRYDGSWFNVDTPAPGFRQTSRIGSSVGVGISGDMTQWKRVLSGQVDLVFQDNGAVITNAQLDRVGWHEVNVTVDNASTGGLFALHGMWYHPTPNVTRMADVWPVQAKDDSNESNVIPATDESPPTSAPTTPPSANGGTDDEIHPGPNANMNLTTLGDVTGTVGSLGSSTNPQSTSTIAGDDPSTVDREIFSPNSSPKNSPGISNTTAIIIGTVSGVLVLLIGVLVAILILRRRRNRRLAADDQGSGDEDRRQILTPGKLTRVPSYASVKSRESSVSIVPVSPASAHARSVSSFRVEGCSSEVVTPFLKSYDRGSVRRNGEGPYSSSQLSVSITSLTESQDGSEAHTTSATSQHNHEVMMQMLRDLQDLHERFQEVHRPPDYVE